MAIQDRLGGSNLANRLGNSLNKVSGDARNKLIQKKRANIKDARDTLGQITKGKGDAREILKNKQKNNANTDGRRPGGQFRSAGGDVRVDYQKLYENLSPALRKKILANVTQKSSNTVQNRRRIAVQPKAQTSMRNGALVRTVKGSPQKRPVQRPVVKPAPKRKEAAPVRRTLPNVRSTDRDRSLQRAEVKMMQERSSMRRPPVWEEQRRMEYVMARPRPTYVVEPAPQYITLDEWDSRHVPAPAPARNNTFISRPPAYDFEYAPPPRKTYLSTGMMGRLDEERRPAVQQSSSGYKIRVANLHRAVTIEDVEELFGNIGPLSSVKMIEQGTAEVVFLIKEDAYKSIEDYHYRLLDGQPMNVTVVSDAAPVISKRNTLSNKQKTTFQQASKSATTQSTKQKTTFQPTSKRFVQETETVSTKPAKSLLRAAGGSKKFIMKASATDRRAYSPPTPKPQFYPSSSSFRRY